MTSGVDDATAYARAVAAGRIVAGPHVRDACARHLRDLREGRARGLRWDAEAAARFWRFCSEVCRLNGGQFEGKPFELLPWQRFVTGCIFGWKNADGTRRFRTAYVETAKGSGKSPLSAAIGLYCLRYDDEPRAEVYAAGSKRDQAMILFRDAVAMFKQSPKLLQNLAASGGEGNEWNLRVVPRPSRDGKPPASGFFRPIASEDSQSGPRPSCALVDELHEHRDATVLEMLEAGQKFRRNPLTFIITNAGSSRTSVCHAYHDLAVKVAAGAVENDTFFAYVCALDPGDDPMRDESCWAKANPSLGATFGPEYLRKQVVNALGMPSKEGVVLRLNFCVWTDAVTAWIDRDLWEACEGDFDPDALAGLPCHLGLDLSSKRDLTGLAAVWEHPDGTLSLATWAWTPGDTLAERARRDNVPYEAWRDAGHLFAPPGRLIDKALVARFVQDFAAKHDVRNLAYDQAQADDFLAALDDVGLEAWIYDGPKSRGDGLRMVRHGQGWAGYLSRRALWMPRSVNEIEERIVRGRVRVRPSPVLRWNSASAVLETDDAGGRKWTKRKSTGRIDCIVAAAMAVGVSQAVLEDGAMDLDGFLDAPVFA